MQDNDLISRAAAIRAVHEEFDECLVWDESGETTANAVESVLHLVQYVDAEPVRHGRWIDDCCSLCGQYVYSGDARNYCPRCGACMMDGGEDDA